MEYGEEVDAGEGRRRSSSSTDRIRGRMIPEMGFTFTDKEGMRRFRLIQESPIDHDMRYEFRISEIRRSRRPRRSAQKKPIAASGFARFANDAADSTLACGN
ncbi:hypothetical protein L596_007110 [Steinernema carpocapsae]|uniref:Uncharacterized protein n=1 Tax=Steinernema carpocapsae TaxID=34508 RepID=A0A4U5P903_STECR|nr:hypothetical protein L596_007110 [Steinernema carpocapsae]